MPARRRATGMTFNRFRIENLMRFYIGLQLANEMASLRPAAVGKHGIKHESGAARSCPRAPRFPGLCGPNPVVP